MIWDNQNESLFGTINCFSIKALCCIDTEDYAVFLSEYKAILPLLKASKRCKYY